MTTKSGIYKIAIGPNYYFGKAKNLRSRKNYHLSFIRRGKHHNRFMQSSYDKYGEFEFTPLVICEGAYMDDLEVAIIKKHIDDNRCMNFVVEEPSGCRRFTPEMRAKISEAGKGRVFSEEHRRRIGDANRGRKHTKESRERLSKSAKSRQSPLARCIVMHGPNGEEFYFGSIAAVGRYFGYPAPALSVRINGRMPWPSSKQSKLYGWSGCALGGSDGN